MLHITSSRQADGISQAGRLANKQTSHQRTAQACLCASGFGPNRRRRHAHSTLALACAVQVTLSDAREVAEGLLIVECRFGELMGNSQPVLVTSDADLAEEISRQVQQDLLHAPEGQPMGESCTMSIHVLTSVCVRGLSFTGAGSEMHAQQ